MFLISENRQFLQKPNKKKKTIISTKNYYIYY